MASSDLRRAALALLVLLTGCATAGAAGGDPDWKTLPLERADGTVASVQAVLDAHRATVFVFWATQCPCVRRYQQRVEDLARAWSAKAVAFVGVDANADDTLADIARVRGERGVTIPVLRDDGGRLARALKARSTPTVVLVRRDGSVAFKGWLDNERQPGESGREPWLEQALEGLDGAPFAAASPTWGCAITRSLRSVPECHAPPPTEASASAANPGVTP